MYWTKVVYCIFSINFYHHFQCFYRYHVSLELCSGHLVVGKYNSFSRLAADEITSIRNLLPLAVFNPKTVVYDRVLINGIMYSTINYLRLANSSDHIFSLVAEEQTLIGSARKFVSLCDSSCVSCLQPCKHIVIVESLPLLNIEVSNVPVHEVRGKQHHFVGLTRLITIFVIISALTIFYIGVILYLPILIIFVQSV